MLESKLRLRTARHDNLKLWCKLCAVLLLLAVTTACAPNSEPTAEAKTPAPLPVKAVIVTMFEIGEDEGDTAGEFQLWKERRNLNERIPFPQSHHDLFYNSESQILCDSLL